MWINDGKALVFGTQFNGAGIVDNGDDSWLVNIIVNDQYHNAPSDIFYLEDYGSKTELLESAKAYAEKRFTDCITKR